MNCKEAEGLMHEILDGAEAYDAEFEHHLVECTRCRVEWRQLQRLERAVRAGARRAVPAERREQAIAAILQQMAAQPTRTVVWRGWPRWVTAAAVIIVAFSLGLGAGRTVRPREVIVTKTVKVPEVRKQIVKVEVPVIQERVVVKRVPVYKTRIVYRERETIPLIPVAERQREPVKCDEILVRLPSSPIAATAHVSEEVQPAGVLGAGESDETPPTQGHWQPPDGGTECGAEMVIAQNLSD